MNRVFNLCFMLGALAGLGQTAEAAGRLDLTGEWHGSEICDEVDDGERGVFVETSPIFIQQEAGGRFSMLFRLEGGEADVLYEGITQRLAGGGHEAVAVACGGAFRSQEVIRFRPLVGGPEAFLNGDSQFFTNDFPGGGGSVNLGTCKYAYVRVSTFSPPIESCPTSPITGD